MKKATLSRVNGEGKVNGKVSRKVLERNAMDILTFDGSMDFDDALDAVELATYQELVKMVAAESGEDTLAIAADILEDYENRV